MRSVGQRFPPLPPRAHSPPPSWGFARQPNHGGDSVVERRAIAKPSRLQFTIATPALRHERSPPFTSNLFQRPRHDDEMIPGDVAQARSGVSVLGRRCLPALALGPKHPQLPKEQWFLAAPVCVLGIAAPVGSRTGPIPIAMETRGSRVG